MNILFAILFVFVAAALAAQGVRNASWSLAKEEARFKYLVAHGLGRMATENGLRGLLFSGALAFAARYVPYSLGWQILSLVLALFASIGLAIGRFALIQTPTLEEIPPRSKQIERVRFRKATGLIMLAVATVWVWNGLPAVLN